MIPGGDVGLAIIATVLLVKTILLPISIKAAKTQKAMREIEPKLKEIKEKHKDNRQELAQATMAIYKEAGMNPLASIFLIFLQIPIIIALYYSVSKGGGIPLPDINLDLLYSFVMAPVDVTMNFIGWVDITERSFLLALGAGITQYFHVHLTMPKLDTKKRGCRTKSKRRFYAQHANPDEVCNASPNHLRGLLNFRRHCPLLLSEQPHHYCPRILRPEAPVK